MDLDFDRELAVSYKSGSQRARVLTEDWMHRAMYCAACGHFPLAQHARNHPAGDFHCSQCKEQYELKSGRRFGTKIVDGAYSTMIERLSSTSNPSLVMLTYDPVLLRVKHLTIIPKYFFTAICIEPRKKLSDTAVRKGWIGCNILLGNIPEPGIIRVIENETALPKAHVRSVWDRMLFLKEDRTAEARTWTVETLRLIDRLPRTEFSLAELYRAEPELKKLFPRNGHIKAKLRQQVQRLRDTGYLKSAGKGVYRVAR